MLEFIDNIDRDTYIKFYNKNNVSFMQSYEWGQFNKIGRNQIPHYVGMKKDGELICAALLLEKKVPFRLSYFYSPRGFIIDFYDKNIVEQFIYNLKLYIKKKNAIYLKFDPEIEYQEIDENGKKIIDGYNNYDIYNHLLSLDLKHTGFIKNFENNQPRYTFIIDLTNDLNILEKNIHKSIMKKIKKTFEYDMIMRESNDVETFYNLLLKTSKKDNFLPYSKKYYENAYKIMNGTYKLFELVIDPKKLYNERQKKLEEINSNMVNFEVQKINNINNINEIKLRLEKEIKVLDNYKDLNELVICSQMCACTKQKLSTLYIGNDEIGKELFAVNRMYYEIIKYGKENNLKQLDLFGTTGDVNNTIKNLSGIHKFKQNFGGKYIEFIGEFDFINKKVLYNILPILLKIYRKGLKFKNKIKNAK